MASRSTVVALGVALVAAAAAGLWWMSRDADEPVEAPRADAPGAVATPSAPDQPTTGRGLRRNSDAGALVGAVRVFGTDAPVGGAKVSLASGDVVLDAATQADGSFAFSRLPDAADWTLAVVAVDGLGEARRAGIVVVPRQTTDVGVVYLAPSFAVPGVVVDERGRPLDGVSVVVMERGPEQGFDLTGHFRELPRPLRPAQEAKSDADGRFRLTGLPPGTYLVSARKPGYAGAFVRDVIVAPTATLPVRLVLASGHRVSGRVVRADGGPVGGIPVVAFRMKDLAAFFDAAPAMKIRVETEADGSFALDGLVDGNWWILAAPPGEAISMGDPVVVPRQSFLEIRVGGGATLVGRVTGAGDAPVADAEVVCESGQTVALARTNGEGRYELRGLATGTARVFRVHADGYCAFGVDSLFDKARRAESEFPLSAGVNTRDVKLLSGGKVRGVVVEAGTTTGVPAATVTALTGAAFLDVAPSATTDGAGRFEISGVPVGAGVLVVRKPGWCQADAGVFELLQALKPFGEVDNPIDGTAGPSFVLSKQGEVAERTIALTRGVSLRGRVTGPEDRPVAGARVTVGIDPGQSVGFGRTLAEKAGGGGDPSRLTDDDGRFEIPVPVVAGKVHVEATAPGFRPDSQWEIEIGGAAPPPDVELKLRVGGTIEGRVSDASGAPVEAAVVTWRRTPNGAFDPLVQALLDMAESSDDHGRTTTAADGSYRLALVDPSPSSVVLDVRDGRHRSERRGGLRVDDGKTLRVDVTLEPGLSISGRVVRADGAPATGAWIDVARDGVADPAAAAADDALTIEPDGRFRVAALAAGKYRLTAHSREAGDSDAVVVAAGVEGVELRLKALSVIAGAVRFRDGRPAAGVDVTAIPCEAAEDEEDEMPDASDEATTVAGADGSFRITLKRGVACDVVVDGRSHRPGVNVLPRRVKRVAVGTDHLAIEVDVGLTIAGRVAAEGGAAPPAGVVSWRRVIEEAAPVGEAPDDSQAADPEWLGPSHAPLRDGRFELTSLAPGKYVVSVTAKPYATQTLRVDAGTRDVLVRLAKGGVVKGRVLLPNGAPAFFSSVMVADESDADEAAEWPECQTDEEGRFVLGGVAAGVHRLVAYDTDDEDRPLNGEAKDVRVVAGETVSNVQIRLKRAGER
jgi:hypothetical protein